jgi:hypothetical protein
LIQEELSEFLIKLLDNLFGGNSTITSK